MRRLGQKVAFAFVSMSLIASSTIAVASAPVTAQAAPASDGWVTLSMLTPSSSTMAASAGVAAAQPETPPPPPPPEWAGPGTPPLPVILIWLAVLGVDVWILTRNHHHHPIPNSPA